MCSTHFDTCVVANLNIIDQFAFCYDYTSTFMASDEGELCRERPVAVHRVQVCVTHSGIFDVDKNLVRTWLYNRNLLVIDRSPSLLDDPGPTASLGYFDT